jgi:hypothetical protein
VTVQYGAELLDYSTATIIRWADSGAFGEVTRTPGGHRRILLSEIRKFAAEEAVRAERRARKLKAAS